jgi:hypothetical protein
MLACLFVCRIGYVRILVTLRIPVEMISQDISPIVSSLVSTTHFLRETEYFVCVMRKFFGLPVSHILINIYVLYVLCMYLIHIF